MFFFSISQSPDQAMFYHHAPAQWTTIRQKLKLHRTPSESLTKVSCLVTNHVRSVRKGNVSQVSVSFYHFEMRGKSSLDWSPNCMLTSPGTTNYWLILLGPWTFDLPPAPTMNCWPPLPPGLIQNNVRDGGGPWSVYLIILYKVFFLNFKVGNVGNIRRSGIFMLHFKLKVVARNDNFVLLVI